MDLREITSITEQLVTDGVVNKALLKTLQADVEIVSVGGTPVIANILGDTLPTDRTLLKQPLLIQHGAPEIKKFVKYTRVLSPHPFVDGLRLMAYPPGAKPSVKKLTHADGLVLGKSDHIEPVVNELLNLKTQKRKIVLLLDDAAKYESVLKQKPKLQVQSVDGSDRRKMDEMKTALKKDRIDGVRDSLIKALKYELEDLPLALALRRIDTFYLSEIPKADENRYKNCCEIRQNPHTIGKRNQGD